MFWGWDGTVNNTWTQCRHLQLHWSQIPGTQPTPMGPYKLTFYLEGNEPLDVDLGEGTLDPTGQLLTYDWPVVLPTGGPYQVSLTDANGATGGVCSFSELIRLVEGGADDWVLYCRIFRSSMWLLRILRSRRARRCR